jgi:hypothetical protein
MMLKSVEPDQIKISDALDGLIVRLPEFQG